LCDDEERPWATYNKGKPISAKQIGLLLRSFSIISETLHPSGEKDAKGYKRDKFTEAFERYLIPAKDAPKALTPGSRGPETSSRPNADETGTSSDFRKRPETNPDGSKKRDFSTLPAVWTAGREKTPKLATKGVLRRLILCS
jgi:hypothetical protein